MNRGRTLLITICLFLFAVTGCVWQVGGEEQRETRTEPTLGEQLLDLHEARQKGAISENEYRRLRRQILEDRSTGASE